MFMNFTIATTGRPISINLDHVRSFYPTGDGDARTDIVIASGLSTTRETVKGSYEEIRNRIMESELNER
jgi:hypothetical protein